MSQHLVAIHLPDDFDPSKEDEAALDACFSEAS